jgi:hypothetical protein
MPFDVRRVLNRNVRVRDRTGCEYTGVIKEVHLDMFVLVNGDGTETFVSRSGANVVSVRVFP